MADANFAAHGSGYQISAATIFFCSMSAPAVGSVYPHYRLGSGSWPHGAVGDIGFILLGFHHRDDSRIW